MRALAVLQLHFARKLFVGRPGKNLLLQERDIPFRQIRSRHAEFARSRVPTGRFARYRLVEEEGSDRAADLSRDREIGISFVDAVIERRAVLPLADARPEMADMATLVIVGNSATRKVGRWVYAPRRAS